MLKWLATLLCLITVSTLPNSSLAQIGPEAYALSHLLSSIQGPSVEAAGRGGAFVAVPDPWSGNPAHVVGHKTKAIVHYGWNDFQNGSDFRYQSIKLTTSINEKMGLMINGAKLRSNTAEVALLPIPATFQAAEDNLTLSLGYKLNSQVDLGLTVAPVMNVDISVNSPLGKIAQVQSQDSYGVRIGAQWQINNNLATGIIHDNYYEDSLLTDYISESSPISLGGKYHSVITRIGTAYQYNKTLFAVDCVFGKHSGPFGYKRNINGFYWGIDQRIGPNLILRTGSYDGASSFGLSYQEKRYDIRYAYVQGISDDELHPVFGDSKTHYIMIEITF